MLFGLSRGLNPCQGHRLPPLDLSVQDWSQEATSFGGHSHTRSTFEVFLRRGFWLPRGFPLYANLHCMGQIVADPASCLLVAHLDLLLCHHLGLDLQAASCIVLCAPQALVCAPLDPKPKGLPAAAPSTLRPHRSSLLDLKMMNLPPPIQTYVSRASRALCKSDRILHW